MAIKPFNRKIQMPESMNSAMALVPAINRSIKENYEGQNSATYTLNGHLSRQEYLAISALYLASGWNKVEKTTDRDGNYLSFQSRAKPKYLGVKDLDYSVPFGPDAINFIDLRQERKVSSLEKRIDNCFQKADTGESYMSIDLNQHLSHNEFKELEKRYLDAGWRKVELNDGQIGGKSLIFYR